MTIKFHVHMYMHNIRLLLIRNENMQPELKNFTCSCV